MNNPFEYTNDLSSLNNDFNNLQQYFNDKKRSAKSDSILKKGQDLAKQSQDLLSAGSKISSATQEIIGGVAAKKIISGIVKPGIEKLTTAGKSALRVGKNVISQFKNVQGNVNESIEGGGAKIQPVEEEAEEKESEEGADFAIKPFKQTAQAVTKSVTKDSIGTDEIGGAGFKERLSGDGGGEEKGNDGDEEADEADEEVDEDVDEGVDDGVDLLKSGLSTGGKVLEDAAPEILGDAGADAAAVGTASTIAGSSGAVASADWWNPVGWVAGLVAVGAGIYTAVEASQDNTAAAKAGTAAQNEKPSYSGNASFAGRYIVPVQSSISSF